MRESDGDNPIIFSIRLDQVVREINSIREDDGFEPIEARDLERHVQRITKDISLALADDASSAVALIAGDVSSWVALDQGDVVPVAFTQAGHEHDVHEHAGSEQDTEDFIAGDH